MSVSTGVNKSHHNFIPIARISYYDTIAAHVNSVAGVGVRTFSTLADYSVRIAYLSIGVAGLCLTLVLTLRKSK